LTRLKYQKCTPRTLEVSAQLGAVEMLESGITTVGEVMDIGTGWKAMLEFGLQGIAYQEVFGPSESTAAEAMQALQAKVSLHRQRETETQRIGISPHAPFSVSAKLFTSVRDYARSEGLRMTSHAAESHDETLFVRDGAGAFAESHRRRGIGVVAHGCSPVRYLDQLDLLGPDMLLAHAIETDAADFERLRESGTFVVHCPRSNAYLGHGVAPVCEMRRTGVTVSIGTDSVASNENFDMFAEMRAVVTQQQLSFEEAFRMANIEGARALGLERFVGSLEPGKRADLVVVALENLAEGPLQGIVSRGRADKIKATVLGGRPIEINRALLVDEARSLQEELRRASHEF
jgi:5-methylthioadenosine/S-adenosylhomocysteine deaminase